MHEFTARQSIQMIVSVMLVLLASCQPGMISVTDGIMLMIGTGIALSVFNISGDEVDRFTTFKHWIHA